MKKPPVPHLLTIPEAADIERVLAGLCETILHDDHLLAAASAIFDGLLAGFVKEEQPNE